MSTDEITGHPCWQAVPRRMRIVDRPERAYLVQGVPAGPESWQALIFTISTSFRAEELARPAALRPAVFGATCWPIAPAPGWNGAVTAWGTGTAGDPPAGALWSVAAADDPKRVLGWAASVDEAVDVLAKAIRGTFG